MYLIDAEGRQLLCAVCGENNDGAVYKNRFGERMAFVCDACVPPEGMIEAPLSNVTAPEA